jgi:hypothetical protein
VLTVARLREAIDDGYIDPDLEDELLLALSKIIYDGCSAECALDITKAQVRQYWMERRDSLIQKSYEILKLEFPGLSNRQIAEMITDDPIEEITESCDAINTPLIASTSYSIILKFVAGT